MPKKKVLDEAPMATLFPITTILITQAAPTILLSVLNLIKTI